MEQQGTSEAAPPAQPPQHQKPTAAPAKLLELGLVLPLLVAGPVQGQQSYLQGQWGFKTAASATPTGRQLPEQRGKENNYHNH